MTMVRNRLLAGLDATSFRTLAPCLTRVALARRAVLQDHFHRIEHVYFIERGVASLYARTRADGPVEVAQIGPFGCAGIPAILGSPRSPHRCLMQVPGEALRIAVPDLLAAMQAAPAIRNHLLAYIHALLVQNAQAALCNGRHDLEQRLCRWLLLAADRLDDTLIPITHEMLAINLGVRRAGVTTLLGQLHKSGVIAMSRASCRILDRAALERRACECHAIIAAQYRALGEQRAHVHVLDDATPPRRELVEELRVPQAITSG
ncbi:MAG TPA: Crp/Fnr family transcriptional regulator [Xanthobacteraceae bacterium]|nr:Crp/Fnr family transcriptional regulator [Xanthobacteraceae bacterium]